MSEQEHDSQKMVNKAWDGLRKVGQPVLVSTCVAAGVLEVQMRFGKTYYGLLSPAICWALVGVAIASAVNIAEDKFELALRNYIYYTLIGCLASVATVGAASMQFMFQKLNEGFFKGVFVGTTITVDDDPFNQGLTLGLCVMVGFHTLYTAFQRKIFDFAFNRN